MDDVEALDSEEMAAKRVVDKQLFMEELGGAGGRDRQMVALGQLAQFLDGSGRSAGFAVWLSRETFPALLRLAARRDADSAVRRRALRCFRTQQLVLGFLSRLGGPAGRYLTPAFWAKPDNAESLLRLLTEPVTGPDSLDRLKVVLLVLGQ